MVSIIDYNKWSQVSRLREIQDYYRVGLTWTSNALEGDSLTENETKVLLEDELTAGGNRRINEQTVLKMHELFYQNIDPAYAGRYRDVRGLITGSQYPVAAPKKIQKEMDGLFAWAQKERGAQGFHRIYRGT